MTHRVPSDELWVHSGGEVLALHVVLLEGVRSPLVLGLGAHAVVPAGHSQAARPAGPRFAHVTCAVAPGFEFADFELAEFERAFPNLPGKVLELARL